jgi:hypothetical protein
MEDRPLVTWGEDAVRVAAPARTRQQQLGHPLVVPVAFSLMAVWIGWLGYPAIMQNLLEPDYANAAIFAVAVGLVMTMLIGSAVLVWRLAVDGQNIVVADRDGLQAEMRIGSWVPVRRRYPWRKIKWVRVESKNPMGRLSYGTVMGPIYFAPSLDAETADKVARTLESWRIRSGTSA